MPELIKNQIVAGMEAQKISCHELVKSAGLRNHSEVKRWLRSEGDIRLSSAEKMLAALSVRGVKPTIG